MIKDPTKIKTGDILCTESDRMAEVISVCKVKGCKEFHVKIFSNGYTDDKIFRSSYLKMGPWMKWKN